MQVALIVDIFMTFHVTNQSINHSNKKKFKQSTFNVKKKKKKKKREGGAGRYLQGSTKSVMGLGWVVQV